MTVELMTVYRELELNGSLFNVLDDLFVLFPGEVEKIVEMAKLYESLCERVEERYLEEMEEEEVDEED